MTYSCVCHFFCVTLRRKVRTHMRRWVLLIGLWLAVAAQAAVYTPASVPNPKKQGQAFYVANLDSIDKYEDVDFNLSFSENVHNIFFKIFKNNLMNIKNYYVRNEVFESQAFLDSFDDEEYKLFFEKLIVTLAFDFFISSMKYLDNSLSMRFNLIYNFADTRLKGKAKNISYYKYSLSIPKN